MNVEDIADWVRTEDKLPLLLATSLYNDPVVYYQGFELDDELSSQRLGLWVREDEWIIGLRGTALGSPGGAKDVADDRNIAFGPYCDLTLVSEANVVIKTMLTIGFLTKNAVVAGHSLGGAASICVGSKHSIRAVSFNGGASLTNPVLSGPGPLMAVHYHVFGDIISSHMGPDAAQVFIIGDNKCVFGSLHSHAVERLYKRDGPKRFYTPDEEDKAFKRWGLFFAGTTFLFGQALKYRFGASFMQYVKKGLIVLKNPIPGSSRWNNRNKSLFVWYCYKWLVTLDGTLLLKKLSSHGTLVMHSLLRLTNQ